jgi:hypothetical protein
MTAPGIGVAAALADAAIHVYTRAFAEVSVSLVESINSVNDRDQLVDDSDRIFYEALTQYRWISLCGATTELDYYEADL